MASTPVPALRGSMSQSPETNSSEEVSPLPETDSSAEMSPPPGANSSEEEGCWKYNGTTCEYVSDNSSECYLSSSECEAGQTMLPETSIENNVSEINIMTALAEMGIASFAAASGSAGVCARRPTGSSCSGQGYATCRDGKQVHFWTCTWQQRCEQRGNRASCRRIFNGQPQQRPSRRPQRRTLPQQRPLPSPWRPSRPSRPSSPSRPSRRR